MQCLVLVDLNEVVDHELLRGQAAADAKEDGRADADAQARRPSEQGKKPGGKHKIAAANNEHRPPILLGGRRVGRQPREEENEAVTKLNHRVNDFCTH